MNKDMSRKIIVAVAPVAKEKDMPAPNPLSPDHVAETVVDCANAGAAMVHLHVRDKQGEQTEDITDFSNTLDMIAASSDIIIQGSTGGLTTLTLEERCVAVNDPRVEVASLNMGSVNFGEDVYINKLPDIRYWARRMEETNVSPELEIFSMGMLPSYLKLKDEGVLKPPYSINICLGFLWALPADVDTLSFTRSRLPEKKVPWGLIHDGMQDFSLLAAAISMGAAVVRVGFEDSVYYAPGKAAQTNAGLVKRLVAMIHDMGYEVATCKEARRILGLSSNK